MNKKEKHEIISQIRAKLKNALRDLDKLDIGETE